MKLEEAAVCSWVMEEMTPADGESLYTFDPWKEAWTN